MSEHGTTSRYTRGCRCAPCRAANAEYQRAYQARRSQNTTVSNGDGSFTWTFEMSRSVTFPSDTPFDALIDACVDLRAAFAAYHQALAEEPAA